MSDEPRRVQLSRKKGWRMPENTVKVDRTTQWGNDFRVEDFDSAEECVAMEDHDLDKFETFHPADYAEWIKPLVGKNVACWCKIGSPCHGDILLRRAKEFASPPSA